jgi:hypothetical protein
VETVTEESDEIIQIRYKRYLAKLNLRWNLVHEEELRLSKSKRINSSNRSGREEEIT